VRRELLTSLALGLSALALPETNLAALGEPADSISSDRKALSAVQRGTAVHDSFSVQECASDSAKVREYVSPSGVVFAVAWNGLVHPPLAPLLGSYAGEYRDALRRSSREPGRRNRQVKSEHVIVETWGHMRNLQGRAYLPALLPLGVTLDEIK
jgi:hypothetical protein